MESLLINQDFRSLIPPLDTTELSLLEESILEEGVRDAIVVWDGYIVDGHNRYDIITKHGITDYRIVHKNFPDIEAVKIWIKKNQIGRRNIAPFLRGEYYLEVKEWEEKRRLGKANIKAHQFGADAAFVNSQKPHINTTHDLAKTLSIGEQAASRIIQIHDKAPDLIKEKCRTGEMSIREGYIATKVFETLPESDRNKAIELVENGEAKNLITARRLIQRENAKGIKPPEGKYQVLYADPPWEYDFGFDIHGAALRHYNTMTIDELAILPINNLADDNSVLFLWVTSPKLQDSFQIIEAWGFEYKTSFIWDKVKHVMGQYNSLRHEFLLVCTRGSYPKQSNTLHDSVLTIERSNNHSSKPIEFRNLIEDMYPGAAKIELFARDSEPISGWTFWGLDK